MKMAGKIISLVIMGCILLFLGTCYFQNCRGDQPKVDAQEAKYEVILQTLANGQWIPRAYFYSDDVTVTGQGSAEVVTMSGYWENVSGEYVFKDVKLTLEEKIFGEIEVRLNGN